MIDPNNNLLDEFRKRRKLDAGQGTPTPGGLVGTAIAKLGVGGRNPTTNQFNPQWWMQTLVSNARSQQNAGAQDRFRAGLLRDFPGQIGRGEAVNYMPVLGDALLNTNTLLGSPTLPAKGTTPGATTDYSAMLDSVAKGTGGSIYQDYIPGQGKPITEPANAIKMAEQEHGADIAGDTAAKAWIDSTNSWLKTQNAKYHIMYEWDPTGGVNPWTGEWDPAGGFKVVQDGKTPGSDGGGGWGYGGGGGGGGGKSYADWFNALYWKF
jgi:hypothetical protein